MKKERVEELFKIIKEAQDELKEIRKECKHEATHKGWYSPRIASFRYGTICDVCHKFIEADKVQPNFLEHVNVALGKKVKKKKKSNGTGEI